MQKWTWRLRAGILVAVIAFAFVGNAAESRGKNRLVSQNAPDWPRFTLRAEKTWQLNPPHGERFDASALLLDHEGRLLTVSDRGALVYRIQFLEGTNAASLVPLSFFTEEQLAPFASKKHGRWDCEGLAEDSEHRIYLCEEANRWIVRIDPATEKVKRLKIDWTPVEKYFHKDDRNASFEGIAVNDGKLFVANERQVGRIIVVDLKTLKVIDHFSVCPSNSSGRDIHFCDLCWFDGALFVLLRDSHVVLKINPESHAILAEYDFGTMEHEPDVDYVRGYAGLMEGLAVDKDSFWLVVDNNGFDRKSSPGDIRPTLFKCKRPDR